MEVSACLPRNLSHCAIAIAHIFDLDPTISYLIRFGVFDISNLLPFLADPIIFLTMPFVITGFGLVKDNGTIVENTASADIANASSLWDDGVSTAGMSPVASSNGHIKDVRHYRAGDQAPESELAYDFGDESVRSPGSAGRSASGSPFKSSRFGVHDSSPTKKGTYRCLFSHFFSCRVLFLKV